MTGVLEGDAAAAAPQEASAFPVSFEQQRLWGIQEITPQSTAYQVPVAVRLSGSLDVAALRAALDALLARHEVLRTSIRSLDGAPYQHIPPYATAPFELIDVPDGSPEALATLVEDAAFRPFTLADGPLMRTTVFRAAPDDHVLVVSLHHAVVDAESVTVLLDELATLYDAHRRGEPANLPRLAIQYADYAVWQRTKAAAPNGVALAYWRDRLRGQAPNFSLSPGPGGRSVPAPAARAGTVHSAVPLDVSSGVRALAARSGTTPMAVLLAGLAVVLHRQAAVDDVTVLAAVSNRTKPQLDRLVGFLVNTVVMRVGLARVSSVTELIARVHHTCADAYAHLELPFDTLVDTLAPPRQIGQTPFSDVMFAYQDGVPGDSALTGLEADRVDLPARHAKCEVVFDIKAAADGYRIEVCYRADIIEHELAVGLLDAFRAVLGQFVSDARRPIAELVVPTVAVRPSAPDRSMAGSVAEPVPPGAADPVAERLAEQFAGVLGMPTHRVGRHDDFFALGGNSLLAMRLISKVRKSLAAGLPARIMFEQPTVAGLARWIAEHAAEPGRAERPATPDGAADEASPIPRLDRPPSWTAPPAPSGPRTRMWVTPMSFAQQRLWFLEQLEPGTAAYHVPVVLRVVGALDVAALRLALADLVARHEMLRASFAAVDGQPAQRIAASGEIAVRVLAGQGLVASDGKAGAAIDGALWAVVDDEVSRPFDLTQAPLVRVLVVRERPDAHVVVLTMHHIVADGWSASVFVRDVAAMYAGRADSVPPELPDLPVQYADFTAWQAAQLTGERLKSGLRYWRDAFAGAPAMLDLPTDRPRTATPTYRGATCAFELGTALTAGVRDIARAHGVTPFMVLLAALGATLCRHANATEVVIGSPVANRGRAEIADLIGFFVNTLPLRVSVAAGPGALTVADLLARVREVCLGAYAHQDVPFEKMVEAIGARRDVPRSPLFQVMLAFQDELAPRLTLPGLSVELVDYDAGTAKFDLTVVVEDRGETLAGLARYNTDLFDQSTIERLTGHLTNVLHQMVADPLRRVDELTLLSDDEWARQVHGYNAAHAGYATDVTLHALVAERIARTPDAVALAGCLDCTADAPCSDGSAEVTYAQLGERVNRLAGTLERLGAGRGDVIGVLLDRSADLVVAELAVLEAGAAFLPLDPAHPPMRNATIVADAGCRLLVTSTAHSSRSDSIAVPVVLVNHVMEGGAVGRVRTDATASPSSTSRATTANAGDAAYVVYTSGSTGRPKGVVIEHRAIVNNLRWMQQDWPLDARDRLLFKTVHTFDVAVKEIFWPLIAGARVVIAHPGSHRDANEVCSQLARHAATVVHLVPSMLDVVLAVARDRGLPLSSLRIVMSGAEPLPPASHDALLAAVPAVLLHMYGPTETAIAVTGWACLHALGTATLPLGRAMPNTQLYVLDDRMRVVPEGALGELYVGGLAVGRGYLNRPAETARAFVPDPFGSMRGARLYRTGDIARYRSDGLLEFRGRRDDQVKIRGLRIELGEVANAVASHPAVRQSTVSVWPRRKADGTGTPVALVAFVVTDGSVDAPELRGYLRERLPSYLVPGHVELLNALPTGTNGKVDHDRLPPPGSALPESTSDDAPPCGPVQERLVEIWRELLDVAAVGVEASLFDLGGHSLLATRLMMRVHEEFGVDVALRAFLGEPTITALARVIESAERLPVDRIPVLDRSAFHRTGPGQTHR